MKMLLVEDDLQSVEAIVETLNSWTDYEGLAKVEIEIARNKMSALIVPDFKREVINGNERS